VSFSGEFGETTAQSLLPPGRVARAPRDAALLDAWAGDHDREFTEARLAEIRRLLDDERLRGRGVLAERVSTVTAYEQQSAGYDAEAGGGLFAADEPIVAEYLSSREPGVALDAAGGAERRPASKEVRGARCAPAERTAARACSADRRLAGLAVVAEGLPPVGGASSWWSPVAGHLALPATSRLN
jgi:hypothetical protein